MPAAPTAASTVTGSIACRTRSTQRRPAGLRPGGVAKPERRKPERRREAPHRRAVREHRDERQRQPVARRRVDRASSRTSAPGRPAVPRRVACNVPIATPTTNVSSERRDAESERNRKRLAEHRASPDAAARSFRRGRRAAAPPIHFAYCTAIGASSASSARSRAASSGVAVGGTRIAAASPGASLTRTNVSVTTSQNSTNAAARRRMRVRTSG